MLIDSFESWQGYGYPDYWQDYIYELVGVPPGPTSPPEVPRITWRDAMSSDRVPVIALRRRVYCKRTPLYVEARWHPTKGEAISLHGLEKDTRKKSVNRAYLGITLLKVIEAAGRGRQEKPEGFDSYEDAISGMVGVVRVLKRKGQRYRQEDVAEYLLTKTTRFQRTSATQSDDVAHKARLLRKYCQHEGLRWADIVRLACNS